MISWSCNAKKKQPHEGWWCSFFFTLNQSALSNRILSIPSKIYDNKTLKTSIFTDKFTQAFPPNKLSRCTAAPAPASKMVPKQPQRLGRTGVAAGRPARPPLRPLRLLPHSHLLRQLGRGGGDTTAPLGAAGRGGGGGGGGRAG